MSTIKINQLTSQKKLTKRSVGSNIFLKMKSMINRDPSVKGFVLDFAQIQSCSSVIFQVMFHLMQTNFEGDYKLELINHNNLIAGAFKLAASAV